MGWRVCAWIAVFAGLSLPQASAVAASFEGRWTLPPGLAELELKAQAGGGLQGSFEATDGQTGRRYRTVVRLEMDGSGTSATGTWRVYYVYGDERDKDPETNLMEAYRITAFVSQTGQLQIHGVRDGPYGLPEIRSTWSRETPLTPDPGRPLCPHAVRYFQLPANGGPTHLRTGGPELQKSFAAALQRYQAEGGKLSLSVHSAGNLNALNWLFQEGGGLGSLPIGTSVVQAQARARAFCFTSPEQAARLVELGQEGQPEARHPIFNGTAPVEAGSEAALARAIVQHCRQANGGRRLSPGEVLYLALRERHGDATEAVLLAHNTLRCLARGSRGDNELLGLHQDESFFATYLETVRGGALPGVDPAGDPFASELGGCWYHMFGTAYYEIQCRTETSATAAGIHLLAMGLPEAYADPEAGSTEASRLMNGLEQWVRASKGSPRDPEKFCFNVWGAQLGADLYRAIRPTIPRVANPVDPDVEESTIDLGGRDVRPFNVQDLHAYPPLPETAGDSAVVNLLQCPATVVLDCAGERLVLDQRRGSLRGSYPGFVLPYPEADGSWGLLWRDPAGKPSRVTFAAVADGPLRLIRYDLRSETGGEYVLSARPGERWVLDLTRPDAPLTPPLLSPGGARVEATPVGGTGSSSEPAPPAVDVTGVWDSGRFGKLYLKQVGARVYGHYDWDRGQCDGFVDGRTVCLWWWELVEPGQPYRAAADDQKGDGYLELSADGRSLEGAWRYAAALGTKAAPAGAWAYQRLGDLPPDWGYEPGPYEVPAGALDWRGDPLQF